MYKCGFKFKVTNKNITGEIDGVSTTGIYSVVFYENGSMYYRADVYESTITNNIKYGVYEIIND